MASRCSHICRVALVLLFTSVSLADEPAKIEDWNLTTADFHTHAVALRGLGAEGFTAVVPETGEVRVTPMAEFVSAGRISSGNETPPEAGSGTAFTLLLTGGDRLVGVPSGVAGESLVWKSPTLGDISVPFSRLLLIKRGRDAVAPQEQPRQDIVTLANGDTVSGIFKAVADGKVTLQTENGDTPLDMAAVNRIAFAGTAGAASSIDHGFKLRLTDTSVLTVTTAAINGDKLTVTLAGKEKRPVDLAIHQLISIEQVNGPVSWLASRTPAQSEQVPYIFGGIVWPARTDAATDGGPLTVAGHVYDHGIGVHARSRLTYALDGQWAAFRTQYGVDSPRDIDRSLADVNVRILLDGKVVHEASHVRSGSLSDVVLIDLAGAKTLMLECDFGATGDTQDHFDWLQPALLRTNPATRPATTPSTGTPAAVAPPAPDGAAKQP